LKSEDISLNVRSGLLLLDIMENEKKIDKEEKIPREYTLDATKGLCGRLYGSGHDHKPKKVYTCTNCECRNCGKEVAAADILWKVINNRNQPVCEKCGEIMILNFTE
jgi:hypothetical protein